MKITKIFSCDILIFVPLFLCTMIKVIGVPAYFLWYGKSHRFSWQEWAYTFLFYAFLVSLQIFSAQFLWLIDVVHDYIYYRIFKKERPKDTIPKWKEWAVDIPVSPKALDKQRIRQTIQKGYKRILEDDPQGLINKTGSLAEKMNAIARKLKQGNDN